MGLADEIKAKIEQCKLDKDAARLNAFRLEVALVPLLRQVREVEKEKSAYDSKVKALESEIWNLQVRFHTAVAYDSGTPVYGSSGEPMPEVRLVSVEPIRGSGHKVTICVLWTFWIGRNHRQTMEGIPERMRPPSWREVFALHVQHGRNPALTALGVNWDLTLSEHRRFHRLDEKCRPRS